MRTALDYPVRKQLKRSFGGTEAASLPCCRAGGRFDDAALGGVGIPLETRLQMLLDVIQKVVHDDRGQLAPK